MQLRWKMGGWGIFVDDGRMEMRMEKTVMLENVSQRFSWGKTRKDLSPGEGRRSHFFRCFKRQEVSYARQ